MNSSVTLTNDQGLWQSTLAKVGNQELKFQKKYFYYYIYILSIKMVSMKITAEIFSINDKKHA